jgi:hypothetical protein
MFRVGIALIVVMVDEVHEIFEYRTYGAGSVRFMRVRVTSSRTAAHRVMQRADNLSWPLMGVEFGDRRGDRSVASGCAGVAGSVCR